MPTASRASEPTRFAPTSAAPQIDVARQSVDRSLVASTAVASDLRGRLAAERAAELSKQLPVERHVERQQQLQL